MTLGAKLSLLQEAGKIICSSLVLPEVLGALLDTAVKGLLANFGGVFLLNEETGSLSVRALKGFSSEESEALEKSPPTLRESLKPENISQRIKSFLSSQLITPGKKRIGVMFVGRRVADDFDEEDASFLELLADQAALAVENARLHELTQRLTIADERNRIAQEMHDGITQSLFGIGLQLRVCRKLLSTEPETVRKKLRMLERQADESLKEIRCYIFSLKSEDLEKRGLAAAIQRYVKEFGRINNLSCQWRMAGTEKSLGVKAERCLYHIVQESLANTLKHADTRRVQVELGYDEDEVTLIINDDGKGFDVSKILPEAIREGRMGLANMEERVASLNGSLNILSQPGSGTTIKVTLPLLGEVRR
ncbi:MAG: GAF domain-containing sensor histidine kinase [Actinomycetota bacterium]